MEKNDSKEILKAIANLSKNVEALKKDMTEVKENVRKILKVVSVENGNYIPK